MDLSLSESTRLANREFREFLEEVSRRGVSSANPSSALRQIERISARLEQVGRLLTRASRAPVQTEELRREIELYAENLKELRGVLERMEYTMLVERSRLQNIKANLQVASAWAATLKETS